MTINERLKIAQGFISGVAFADVPHCGDVLSQCKLCGEGAWLPKDIKHKKDCKIGIILTGYFKDSPCRPEK